MTRQPISPAAAALMRALDPGDALIQRWRSQPWKSLSFAGERIEIEFECATPAQQERAQEIAAEARDLIIALPGASLADLAASLEGKRLRIEAQVLCQ